MSAPTYFTPYQNVILDITNAVAPIVTTYSDHGYNDGMIVRLIIPPENGMTQMSKNPQAINIISSTTFQIFEDTSNYDPFIQPFIPLVTNSQLPQSLPISEIASTFQNVNKNNGNITPEISTRIFP